MKPLVAVTPSIDVAWDSYWMLPGYFACIEDAGGVPVMLAPWEGSREGGSDDAAALADTVATIVERFDAFLFTGGPDMDPRRYGQEPTELLRETSPRRDVFESALMQAALETGKPILGICRGFQTLNVAAGGTLHQDLSRFEPHPDAPETTHRQEKPYDVPHHEVHLAGPLREILGETIRVNSCHHQGVDVLGERAQAMATAPDGLVEGIWLPDHPFAWGVQWHPEFFGPAHEATHAIFGSFVSAARPSISGQTPIR